MASVNYAGAAGVAHNIGAQAACVDAAAAITIPARAATFANAHLFLLNKLGYW